MAINQKTVECDLLVVGGGLAGTHASIRAKQVNKNLNVTLVDKGYVSMSGSSSFAGGFSAIFNRDQGHDFDVWKDLLVRTGEYMSDRDWVDLNLNNSFPRFSEMWSWGAPFFPNPDGTPKYFPVAPPLYNVRTLSQKFMPVIRKKAVELGVNILDRIFIQDLLKKNGKVVGAVGFHRDGDYYVFKAKAVVVSAGQGSLKAPGYPHDYWTGDGESMCYRAGCSVSNKEYQQQCEFVFRREPALFTVHDNPGSIRVNAEGEEFENNYYKAWSSPDRFHKAEMFEAHAGRSPIYVDFSNCSEEVLSKAKESELMINRMFVRKRIGHDISHGKHEILWGGAVGATGPAAGGIVINTKCETEIPGLYAAGDTAGTNVSGALYGAVGFGLTTATISGYIAGENAAQYISKADKPEIDEEQAASLKDLTFAPMNRKGGFRSSWILQVMQGQFMPYYILGVKNEERLQAALTMCRFIQGHIIPKVRANDPHELRMANELRNMATNIEMGLVASLFRKESRGLHYREDYPNRDDNNWFVWTILKDVNGRMEPSKKELPKEWRPDPSLSYEEKYDFRLPGEVIK